MSIQSESRDVAVIQHKSAKVYGAGGQVLISGPTQADVAEALEILVNEDGAELISHPTKLGSLWLAACSHPMQEAEPCVIHREGFTVIVTGRSEQAVTVAMLKIKERGGQVIELPYEGPENEWAAVLDVAQMSDLQHFDWGDGRYSR